MTFQPKTIALVGYPKVIPYTKCEHFGIICVLVIIRTLVWKMHLLNLWPWPLTFEPQNWKSYPCRSPWSAWVINEMIYALAVKTFAVKCDAHIEISRYGIYWLQGVNFSTAFYYEMVNPARTNRGSRASETSDDKSVHSSSEVGLYMYLRGYFVTVNHHLIPCIQWYIFSRSTDLVQSTDLVSAMGKTKEVYCCDSCFDCSVLMFLMREGLECRISILKHCWWGCETISISWLLISPLPKLGQLSGCDVSWPREWLSLTMFNTNFANGVLKA